MEINGRDRRKQKRTDRLSRLPDSILCHILSFLPTETSVATSILARRWRFVWKYVPILYFKCNNQHVINRVLLLHKLPSLKSFSIEVENCDEFQFETWIMAAIDRKVQYLHLRVVSHNTLPLTLFTCETLVDLRLYDCGEIPTLDDVCLPRLKKLYLHTVDFEDDESLPSLLSGAPVLEYLLIRSYDEINLDSCYVSSRTVKWLCLHNLLNYLGRPEEGHRLEINTPSLEYLSVNDDLSGPIVPGDLASLITADIQHEDNGDIEDETLACVFMLKFVDSLSNVKCLKLDLSSYHTTINDSLLSLWTPSFNSLTKLELIADSRFLFKFLQNADNLEICEFRKCKKPKGSSGTETQHYFGQQTKGWIEPRQVPKCLLSCLRTIKTVDTVDTEDGLETVRYLLWNAKVLKRVDVTYPRGSDSKEKKDLLQKVSLFERGSKACEVVFTEASYKDSFKRDWERISPSGLTF